MALVRKSQPSTRKETIELFDDKSGDSLGSFFVEYKSFSQKEVEKLSAESKEMTNSEICNRILSSISDLNHEDGTPFSIDDAVNDPDICFAIHEKFWTSFRTTRITRGKQSK